jgi:hypothetical protein
MTSYRKSYQRTMALAAVGATGAAAVAAWLIVTQSDRVYLALAGVGCLLAAVSGLVAASGAFVLYRDAHQSRTRSNLFQEANRARSEAAVATGTPDAGLGWRRVLRHWSAGRGFVVGEVVEIKPYDEVVRTLDAEGCYESLPFMPEMKRFCGQRARVFRRVDKIYDYGRTKKLRRLDDAYLLIHLRCDGAAHGGCEAACYILWKSAWLTRARTQDDPASRPQRDLPSNEVSKVAAVSNTSTTKYICQFTQLAAASTPIRSWDVRADLRPLLAGNVTFAAFWVAALTRLFNRVQQLRGGVGYPPRPTTAGVAAPPRDERFAPGDVVRVRDAEEIIATLDAGGRNRGLWFDQDMLKYCGRTCVVRKRVDRLIDDATGLMRVMKSPCIVLEDVDYSGETLRFAAQEEHLYWRDVWLKRVEATATTRNRVSTHCAGLPHGR